MQCMRLHKVTISDDAYEAMDMLTEKVASLDIRSNSLDRAASLLTDSWAHNDSKGCMKLVSFMNRIQVMAGEKLTHTEADDISNIVNKVMLEFIP